MKKAVFSIVVLLVIFSCGSSYKITSNSTIQTEDTVKYPSDVIPFMDEWKILLGDGTHGKN